jgi:hypothetical protein
MIKYVCLLEQEAMRVLGPVPLIAREAQEDFFYRK